MQYSIAYSSRTEAEERTKVITVMWTIPNFISLLDNQNSRRLIRTSKSDCCDNKDAETKFQVKMQFVGKENDLLEIYYLPPEQLFLKTILTICLKCYKERSIVLREYHVVQPNKWQFLGALYKRDILSFDSTDTYLNEGSLNLKFQFMVNKEVKIGPSNPKPQLNYDMQNMFLNSTFTDVTIKSIDGVEFKVHKAILASRSDVLKAHFDHNSLETLTNKIQSPFKTQVLEQVLTYIYTDNAPTILEIPGELLAAADFYQMDRLKHLCEEALYQSLTVDNAIDILELADLHSATNLKRSTLEFISDGHACFIVKTKSWAKLQSVVLIKTILEYIISEGQLEADDLK